jgi:hypothetical protein
MGDVRSRPARAKRPKLAVAQETERDPPKRVPLS